MKLQLGLVSLISLPLWRGVFGGQISVIDGVVGGVPVPSKIRVQHELLKSVVTTPGKLRVVENSGVCGWFAPSLFVPFYIFFLETTPGVFQASGYGDLTASKSLWYDCFTLLTIPVAYRSPCCPSGFGFLPHATILTLHLLRCGLMVE